MGDVSSTPSDPFSEPPAAPIEPMADATTVDGVGVGDLPPGVSEVFVEPEDPKRRGKGMLVGIGAAVLVAAAVGVGIFVATSGGDDPTYSVVAAAESAADANAVAFEQTLTVNGQDASSTGRMDTKARLMAATFSVPALSERPIEMVFDLDNTVMYMAAAPFVDAGAPVDTKWVSIDLSVVPAMKEVFGSVSESNPLDFAKQFAIAKTIKEVGMEKVGDEPAKHYLVTVVTADALKKFPETAAALDKAGAKMEDEVVYDVWVNKANQLRRMKFTTTIDGKEQAQDVTYTAIGTIDPIVVPPEADVTDISKMLGS
jgi:hypothetical protein